MANHADAANAASELVAAVDLGGTKMLGVLMEVVDGRVRIHTRLRRPTQAQGNEAVTAGVLALLHELMQAAATLSRSVLSIGIGSPGTIHPDGVVADATNLSVKDLHLAALVRKTFALPTQVIHDVKAAALAESYFGAGQGSGYLAYLGLGTGIGMGLVLDGKVYQGSLGRAGEVGYVPVRQANAFTVLEAVAAGPAIARQAQLGLHNGHAHSLLAQHAASISAITTEHVAEAARQGDAFALSLLHTAADHIGWVLAGLINVLDLSCVIIGGGMAQMGEMFIEPIRAATWRYVLPTYANTIRIVASELGNDAGAIGAGAAALLAVKTESI